MRQTYVFRGGELVLKEEASPLFEPASAPGVIRDGMDATWHPATGQTFESKSAFRAATKASGCIEIGDQKGYGGRSFTPKLDKAERVQDIKRTIERLKARG